MTGRPPHRPTGKTPAQDHSLEGQASHENVRLNADAHEFTPDPHDLEKGGKRPGKGTSRGGMPPVGEGASNR